MSNKTPISRVQELCAKHKVVPVYEMIELNDGLPNQIFICQVSAFDKVASGKGKSKREAKHNAAAALLPLITKGEDPEDLLHPYFAKENKVGALQDFCLTSKICIPRYKEITCDGSLINKTFVIECILKDFKTEGEGRSKKEAKQVAAYLMLQKINELINDNQFEQLHTRPNEYELEENDKKDKAVAKLCEQLENKPFIPEKKPPLESTRDYTELFKTERFYNSQKWINLPIPDDVENLPNPKDYFCELMIELSMEWRKMNIPNEPHCKDIIVGLQVREYGKFNWFGRGLTEDDAFKDAALSALTWFAIMRLQ